MLLSTSLDGGTLNLLGCCIPELLCAHSWLSESSSVLKSDWILLNFPSVTAIISFLSDLCEFCDAKGAKWAQHRTIISSGKQDSKSSHTLCLPQKKYIYLMDGQDFFEMFMLSLRPRRICPLLSSLGFQGSQGYFPSIHKEIRCNLSREKNNLITENWVRCLMDELWVSLTLCHLPLPFDLQRLTACKTHLCVGFFLGPTKGKKGLFFLLENDGLK